MNIFKNKAYAKVYIPDPYCVLEKKYAVKYKKHFWQKYKVYKDPKKKSSFNYLKSDAINIASKIRNGIIRVD